MGKAIMCKAIMCKAIMINAAVSVFLVGILIFSMMLYRFTEESERRVISSSQTTRISSIEDSLQLAIKRLYEVNQQVSFSLEQVQNGAGYNDQITITAKIRNNGQGMQNLLGDLTRLEAFLSTKLLIADIDVAVLQNSRVQADNGVIFRKVDSSLGSGEQLILLYNESGSNTLFLKNLSFLINTVENITLMNWNTSEPPSGSTWLSADAYDTNGASPDNPVPVTIGQGIRIAAGQKHVLSLRNSTHHFANITLDSEKINITSFIGDFDVSILMITASANKTQRFKIEPEAIYIDTPGISKTSRVEFT